jgi:CDP-diacylglycerol--glycerol-3-phosphate 3-phosphatidyltransferase
MTRRPSDQSLVSSGTRDRIRGSAVPVALAMGRIGLTPNGLTVIGFIGTTVAAASAGAQLWLVAGILVLAFGIFDLFDGALARATGTASTFGAFLDSTLDRTGENLVYAGVAFGGALAGLPAVTGLAGLAVAFASVVTYARAKAEVVGIRGDVGVAPRSERLVLLSVGLAVAGILGVSAGPDSSLGGLGGLTGASSGALVLAGAIALIAVLSAITIIQRIVTVRRQLDQATTNRTG